MHPGLLSLLCLSFNNQIVLFIKVVTLDALQVAIATEQDSEVYHVYRTPFLQENAAAALLKQVRGVCLIYQSFCLLPDRMILGNVLII